MPRKQFVHGEEEIAFAASRQHGRADFADAGAGVAAVAVIQPQCFERLREAVEVGFRVHRFVGGDLRAHVFTKEGGIDGGVEFAHVFEAFRLPARADGDELFDGGVVAREAVSGGASIAETEQAVLGDAEVMQQLRGVVGNLRVGEWYVAEGGAPVAARVRRDEAVMCLQARQQGGEVVRRAQSAVQEDEDGRVRRAAGLVVQRCATVGEGVGLHGVLRFRFRGASRA